MVFQKVLRVTGQAVAQRGRFGRLQMRESHHRQGGVIIDLLGQ